MCRVVGFYQGNLLQGQVAVMDFSSMNDKAILGELGVRIQRRRLAMNISQSELTRMAGVARKVIQNIEGGRGSTLKGLVRTLTDHHDRRPEGWVGGVHSGSRQPPVGLHPVLRDSLRAAGAGGGPALGHLVPAGVFDHPRLGPTLRR